MDKNNSLRFINYNYDFLKDIISSLSLFFENISQLKAIDGVYKIVEIVRVCTKFLVLPC